MTYAGINIVQEKLGLCAIFNVEMQQISDSHYIKFQNGKNI